MDKISEIWHCVQRCLFYVEECLILTDKHRDLVRVLETVRIEESVDCRRTSVLGRMPKDKRALARAFLAKAHYNEPTTKSFIERLKTDSSLRQICGWERLKEIPSESTFSRSFSLMAQGGLLDKVHEARVRETLGDELAWHVSRDSSEIDAREKPVKKEKKPERPKYGRGRPKKGEIRPPKEPNRIDQQMSQSIEEAIAGLSVACDVGTKIDSKGNKRHWVGYKFHVDIIDGGIPVFALTTAASVHDSQAAIPMMRTTNQRIASLYDLMDSAYDAELIRKQSLDLGHVPIIDQNSRGKKAVEMEPDRDLRYDNRTSVERFFSRLKDSCGGRNVRVRGHTKVHAHLMFGLLVIFAEALLGLAA